MGEVDSEENVERMLAGVVGVEIEILGLGLHHLPGPALAPAPHPRLPDLQDVIKRNADDGNNSYLTKKLLFTLKFRDSKIIIIRL